MSFLSSAAAKASRWVRKNAKTIGKAAAVAGVTALTGGAGTAAAVAALSAGAKAAGKTAIASEAQRFIATEAERAAPVNATVPASVEAARAATPAPVPVAPRSTSNRTLWIVGGVAAVAVVGLLVAAVLPRRRGVA